MKFSKLRLGVLLGICGICTVAGCGSRDKPMPAEFGVRFPVQGKVRVGSKLLGGGHVTFHPLDRDEKKLQPFGIIDAQGNYFVNSYGEMGAPAGKYRVTVDPGSDDKDLDRLVANSQYTLWNRSPLIVTVQENAPAGAYDLKLNIGKTR